MPAGGASVKCVTAISFFPTGGAFGLSVIAPLPLEENLEPLKSELERQFQLEVFTGPPGSEDLIPDPGPSQVRSKFCSVYLGQVGLGLCINMSRIRMDPNGPEPAQ